MRAQNQQRIVQWLRQKKIATMPEITRQFGISHMTVFRALKQHGYFSSYDHNAAWYTLHDIPQFDDWGLWAWRDVHFSKFGTLKDTLITLVEQAPAGRTTRELAERLQGDVPHLLSRLVKKQRISCRTWRGRQVVYLSANSQQSQHQWQQRLERTTTKDTPASRLPADMTAEEVIAVLRQIILRPRGNPAQWAEAFQQEHPRLTAEHVERVRQHYALKKKRTVRPSPG